MNTLNRLVLLVAGVLALSTAFAAPFHLLRDVYPGTNSGTSKYLVGVDSKLVFAGQDGFTSTTYLPWTSDGTVSGTVLAGTSSIAFDVSQPRFALNGVAYFVYDDGYNGSQLWRSDGSVAGTFALANATNGFNDYLVLTAYHNLAFFESDLDGITHSLNVTDGTVAGTHSISTSINITRDGSGTPGALLNDKAIFAGFSSSAPYGYGLVVSNGTSAGTTLFLVPGITKASNLVAVNDVVYFVGTDTGGDVELWKTNGTAVGTSRVKDIQMGSGSSNPRHLTRVDDRLFFVASELGSGDEIWVSDGTAAGTNLVKDIRPGAFGSSPTNLTALNGVLYFTANDGTNGTELWRSDGTGAGTTLALGDFVPGSNGAFTYSYNTVQAFNQKLALVLAPGSGSSPTVPYVSDGTLGGTNLVDTTNVVAVFESGLNAANGKLFASGRILPSTYGNELIATDAFATMGNTWCANPEQAIPDNLAGGLNSRFHLPSHGGITALTVSVDIGHTYVGELSISLRHEQTGTRVTLFKQPNNCSGDLVDIIFDDAASSSVQTSCANTRLAYPRDHSYQPANPLSAFDGESLSGDWTLNVTDNAAGKFGVLHEWCMNFETDLIFADAFD